MKQKQIKVPAITPVSNKGPRNAFDLSQRHLFTAPVGALLPVQCTELMPGDHVSMKITDFMRVMPCNSAAFIDCKGSYETFFVPFSQLWKPWNQFITSMQDYNSTLLSNKNLLNGLPVPPVTLPTVDFFQLSSYIDSTLNASDDFGYNLKYGFERLADLLGYGKLYKSDGSYLWDSAKSPYPTSMPVNLFRFLAYQKIYQDVYRNTQYEHFDVSAFNIDDFSSGINVITDSVRLRSIFSLRYRNYGLDYLSNIRPSVLVEAYSAQSVNALQPHAYQDWDNSAFAAVEQTGSLLTNGTSENKIDDVILDNLSVGEFSIRSLRAAFAYQNLLDTMGRAPKTYKDQMKAIFGVDVPMGMEGKVQFVGGVDSSFQFGDVTNTAISASDTTASSPYNNGLGASVSKGTASGSGYMEFDAPVHGILMTIYSVIPQSMYDSTRLDPFNQKMNRTDYYLPQYDHIGMQPLYQSSVSMRNVTKTGATSVVNKCLTHALGWQPRYSEYKTAIDINHGQFTDDGPLKFFTSDRSRGVMQSDFNWLSDLHLRDLKINPNIFDSVFKVSYNGKETTDPFYGSVQFNITKVSNMDRQSMPNV